MFYIYIEDLVANAFVEIFDKDIKFLTYDMLKKYGDGIVDKLNKFNKKALFNLSQEDIKSMYEYYPEWFEEKEINGILGIMLKPEITQDNLIISFRDDMPVEVLAAFSDEKVLNILG